MKIERPKINIFLYIKAGKTLLRLNLYCKSLNLFHVGFLPKLIFISLMKQLHLLIESLIFPKHQIQVVFQEKTKN